MRIVVLTKRQYTNKDVIDDRYGRLWEMPLALARDRHSVTCICLSYRKKCIDSEIYKDAQGHTVRWISVNLGTFVIFGVLKYLYTANKVIRKERPDVIWSCSDTIYTVAGYYLSKLYKCCSVADLYDNFESFASYRVPILRTLFRKVIRDSDCVSCVSESLRRHIVANYRRTKSTSVITNAVDMNMFRPMDKVDCRNKLGLPHDVVLVGSAGDMSNYRGMDTMLQAIMERPADLAAVHLAIAGYRTSDTQIPIAENIYDLGQLPYEDVPLLLNSLDLAVVYNRKSLFGDFCFPQKFYEILACKIPLIAADIGEMSILLQNKSHLLYKDGNVESLVSATKRQLTEREILDFNIPTWHDQALLLQQQIEIALTSA